VRPSFVVIGEVETESDMKLTVSIKRNERGRFVTIAQAVSFKNNAGRPQSIYMKHPPVLNAAAAEKLITLLRQAINKLEEGK
jgi:hypothetical protein